VPARRRRTLDRSPVRRAALWDSKMRGDVYGLQLEATKPLALPRVGGYQATHEHLISLVKEALSSLPSEASVLQEYMWYAEKLWRLTQTYGGPALQKEGDALYLWYLARGRSDIALRTVARALGINISPVEDIMDRVLAPILLKVIARGTLLADGSEQAVAEYAGAVALVSGYLDLSNMVEGDSVTVRSYVRIREGGEYVLYRSETFYGRPPEPALYLLPRLVGYAFKVTLQQTAGAFKNFDYLFVKGT
jgi:hypothetical protein